MPIEPNENNNQTLGFVIILTAFILGYYMGISV